MGVGFRLVAHDADVLPKLRALAAFDYPSQASVAPLQELVVIVVQVRFTGGISGTSAGSTKGSRSMMLLFSLSHIATTPSTSLAPWKTAARPASAALLKLLSSLSLARTFRVFLGLVTAGAQELPHFLKQHRVYARVLQCHEPPRELGQVWQTVHALLFVVAVEPQMPCDLAVILVENADLMRSQFRKNSTRGVARGCGLRAPPLVQSELRVAVCAYYFEL